MDQTAYQALRPSGWAEHDPPLIELIDPAGTAVAWVALSHGANCIGYAVHHRSRWQPVLHSADPATLAALPSRFGCPVLVPFPGHMVDCQYHWYGQHYRLPSNSPLGDRFMHGLVHTRPWRLIDRAPDRLTAEIVTPDCLTPAERAGYPFAIRLRQTLSLTAGALTVALMATNEGDATAPLGLGLHPYIDPTILGGERHRLAIKLPGALTRLGRPVPTGELAPVDGAPVSVPPVGETTLITRTKLRARSVVTLRGSAGPTRVLLRLLRGVNDLVVFAPAEHPSISLEPLSQPLSAASLPEGHVAGLMGLTPGRSQQLIVQFAVAG